jgi:hypothetical protein
MQQLTLNFDLTKEEQTVVNQLWPGRLNATGVAKISKTTGINDRRVRQIVRHLIDDHGLCIGSATDEPAGYFIATDPGEVADIVGAMRHRGISILVRASRISGNSLTEIIHQGVLELEFERETRTKPQG